MAMMSLGEPVSDDDAVPPAHTAAAALAVAPAQTMAPARTMAPAETVRWLTVEEQRHWRSYVDGSARLWEALGRELERDAGLSLSEYGVLVRLSEAPGRTLRMSLLAEELSHSRSRMTHLIGRMQVRGLVGRTASSADGRGVNCTMTDAGYAHLDSAAPGHVSAVRTHLVDVLTQEQMRGLGVAMATIREALDR